VPVIPEGGYKGDMDKEGNPVNPEDYQKWLDPLPTVWQDNPFHSHFVYYDTTVLDDSIKAEIARVTEYFYAFHTYCWDNELTFLSQWVKVPKVAGSIRDVFIAGDSSPPNKAACELKAGDIVSRTGDFDTRSFEQDGSTPPDLNIGEKGTIDVGAAVIDRIGYRKGGETHIGLDNPSNAGGTVDTVTVWFNYEHTGFRAGSFYLDSGTTYICRDSEAIGNVVFGENPPFTGLTISILTGDLLGEYTDYVGGTVGIERDYSGFSGVLYASGEHIDPSDSASYSTLAGDAISLHGTGTEGGGEPDITNTQATWNIGHVQANDIRYFSADNTQDDDYALITNTGGVAVDVQIQGLDIEGGSYDWTLGSSAGDQTYSLYANSEASPTVYDIEVKKADYSYLCEDLAVEGTYNWSMKFTAPTALNPADDGLQKSTTITLVAIAAD